MMRRQWLINLAGIPCDGDKIRIPFREKKLTKIIQLKNRTLKIILKLRMTELISIQPINHFLCR